MDKLKWKKLTEIFGRYNAEGLKSLLEAEGIQVEMFQEAVGSLYPVTVDGLGKVQLFVPKEQFKDAQYWLKIYQKGYKEGEEP